MTSYQMYGFSIASFLPLNAPRSTVPADVTIVEGTSAFFEKIKKIIPRINRPSPSLYHCFPDRSDYACFFDLAEYWVSPDGRKVVYRDLRLKKQISEPALEAASLNYLQANVLSFALLKRGIDPLHASAVVIDGQAVGFIGDSGLGKSTLVASFLMAGYKLLTDDLLVVRLKKPSASPGLPRIKLLPDVGAKVWNGSVAGVRMNPDSTKKIYPLDARHYCSKTAVLKSLYCLLPDTAEAGGRKRRDGEIRIKKLSGRKAVIEIMRGAYNVVVQRPERLANQLHFAADLADAVPVRTLSYPRKFSRLPDVHRAILADLSD